MDDIFFPDESEETTVEPPVEFERAAIEKNDGHPSGVDASNYVKVTFGRFVALVANHSFVEVVERNEDEEVILSTNLLTDLANARRFSPNTKGPVMIVGGIVFGILLGYFLF
ncbi:hypothetical protein HOD30_04675 [Candidatus Peregrinibacteria bacterium]|jgi:hypothetical protein|nr:hypothetical protein [Candidatus Peregrinibacteria bacterium]MBT4632302.1 hypothetical protein [Candidatus Peregrinibacteria bacterium]MBT5516886.1 hypothetical protein [Candidatus Peregrinibacteria bacterium]MBT5824287.1 hypothetical protein [Candidatus Peregrinibacteria bacterium]